MDEKITPFEALQRSVEVAGSQSALARICQVGQPTIWKWLQSSKRLPAEHVLTVEGATGVHRHLLRPDIYPLSHGECLPVLPSVSVRTAPVASKRRRVSHAAARA